MLVILSGPQALAFFQSVESVCLRIWTESTDFVALIVPQATKQPGGSEWESEEYQAPIKGMIRCL